MTAASASPSFACPRCGAANATVARYCLGCGTSLQAGAANGAPPIPPPPPVMQGASAMLGGMGSGGGGSSEATVLLNAQAAFSASQHAIRAAGGTEKYAQPPASLSFELTKKNWYSTSGVTVRYDGVLQVVSTGADQSAVRVQVKAQPGALTPILFIGAISALMLPFFGFGVFGLLLGAVWTGYSWNALANTAAKEMAEKVVQGIQNGGASSWRTAAPAAAPPEPPTSATSVSRASVIGQLSELGKLRDAGVLTDAEFDRKKAELLARL